MEYLIRECSRADLPVVVELCARHAAYERAAYTSEGKLQKLELALFDGNPKLYCVVVEVKQEIIGYASYTFDYSTWGAQQFLYLDCLYLEDNFRGLGIGQSIIDKLKVIAVTNDCINIQWQTPHWNERAIKFYKRIGGRSKEKARFTLSL